MARRRTATESSSSGSCVDCDGSDCCPCCSRKLDGSNGIPFKYKEHFEYSQSISSSSEGPCSCSMRKGAKKVSSLEKPPSLPHCGCGPQAPCKVPQNYPSPVGIDGKLSSTSDETKETPPDDSSDKEAPYPTFEPHVEWAAAQQVFRSYRKKWAVDKSFQANFGCNCPNQKNCPPETRQAKPSLSPQNGARQPSTDYEQNLQNYRASMAKRPPWNRGKEKVKCLVPRRVTYIPNEKLFAMHAETSIPVLKRRVEILQKMEVPRPTPRPANMRGVCTCPCDTQGKKQAGKPAAARPLPTAKCRKRATSPVKGGRRGGGNRLPMSIPGRRGIGRRPSGKLPINILNFAFPSTRKEVSSLPLSVRLCS